MDPQQPTDFTLRHYIRIVLRRKVVVLVTLLVALGFAWGMSSAETPLYRASAEVLVQPRPTDSVFQLQAAQTQTSQAVETEIRILTSRPVRDVVQKSLGAVPRVKARAIPETQIFQVTSDRADPKEAIRIVSTYVQAYLDLRRQQVVGELLSASEEIQRKVDSLQGQIVALSGDLDLSNNAESAVESRRNALISQQSVFRERLDQLQVEASLRTGGVQLASSAEASEEPVSPKPVRTAVLAGIVGLVMGLGFAFLLDYFDDSIKTKEDFEVAAKGLTVLGVIPALPGWRNRDETHLVSVEDPTSPVAESYRTLRTSISFLGLDRTMRVIQITSPSAGEGKTTTIANLAVTLSNAGQQVLLVDCDLRRPRLHHFFGLENNVGFTSVLLGEMPLSRAVQQVPGRERLSVLASGAVPPNPSELLASGRAREVFAAAAAQFDIVLIDSPPVLPVTDPAVLASAVDAVVLVITARQTTKHEVTRGVEMLQQVNAPLIGAVLNSLQADQAAGGYRYYAATPRRERKRSAALRGKPDKQDKPRRARPSAQPSGQKQRGQQQQRGPKPGARARG